MAVLSACVLWAGVLGLGERGGLAGALGTRPLEIFNILYIVTLTAFVLLGTLRLRASAWWVVLVWPCLIIWGSLWGLESGNALEDVAFEARPLLYAFAGAWVGLTMDTRWVMRALTVSALVVGLAIIVTWVGFALAGVELGLVSGLNPGDAFTAGLPLVRPPGGLLVLGAALAISLARGQHILSAPNLVLLAALLATQSRTYWVMIAFVGAISARPLSRHVTTARLARSAAMIVFVTVALVFGLAGRAEGGLLGFVVEKFTSVVEDPVVTAGVVGNRVLEADLMIDHLFPFGQDTMTGHGLGFVYRPVDMFYWREDLRAQHTLAMFGHNYVLWVVLKLGVIGGLVMFGTVAWAMMLRGGGTPGLRTALGVLLVGSLMLGTFETPTGGFVLGALLGSLVGDSNEHPTVS